MLPSIDQEVERLTRERVHQLQERLIFDKYPRLNDTGIRPNVDRITVTMTRKEFCDLVDISFRKGLEGVSAENTKQLRLW